MSVKSKLRKRKAQIEAHREAQKRSLSEATPNENSVGPDAITPKARHKWKPGESGNPNGRPKIAEEIRDLARLHGPTAIQTAANLLTHREPGVRLAAAKLILERGYGKPIQPIIDETKRYDGPTTVITAEDAARAYFAFINGEVRSEQITWAVPPRPARDPSVVAEQPAAPAVRPDTTPIDRPDNVVPISETMRVWNQLLK